MQPIPHSCSSKITEKILLKIRVKQVFLSNQSIGI